jgi:uncharacterized protein (TIGR04255 family)
MSKPAVILKHPPIVEAVLDFECDLPPGQQLGTLEPTARAQYRDQYPRFRKQFIHEHEFEATPGEKAKLSVVENEVHSLHFLTDDEKQLVQVRAQGFSFNRLAPYTSLDDYLPEIERTWLLYVALAAPVQIRTIRLRYINRFLLPTKGRCVSLDKYLRIGPRLPDEEAFTLSGFLSQETLVETETGHQVNLVQTAQLPEGEKLPIILDIGVQASGPGAPGDWAWMLGKIKELRSLKNRIFERTLTEECLKLFQ